VETPLLKPPGLSLCYLADVQITGLFLVSLLLVVALIGVMLWLFFLRGR
jgi:hypothetical protein